MTSRNSIIENLATISRKNVLQFAGSQARSLPCRIAKGQAPRQETSLLREKVINSRSVTSTVPRAATMTIFFQTVARPCPVSAPSEQKSTMNRRLKMGALLTHIESTESEGDFSSLFPVSLIRCFCEVGPKLSGWQTF